MGLMSNAVYEAKEAFGMGLPQADVFNHSLIRLTTSFNVMHKISL